MLRRLSIVAAAGLAVASGAASGGPPSSTQGEIAVATTSGRIVLVDSGGHRLATLSMRAGHGVSAASTST